MASKRNQLSSGVILSYLSNAVQILVTVFYMPLMLKLLGKSEYGIYQMAYSTISYLTLFTFGFSSAYIKFYATSVILPNGREEVARLNGLFLSIFTALGGLVLLVGSILSANSDAVLGGKLTREELDTAKILMWIFVFNAFFHFPQIVFNNYIIAKERFICLQTINLLSIILNPVMTFPLLLMGFRSVGMAVILLLISAGKLLVSIWYCFKKLDIQFSFRKIPFSLLSSVFVFSFYLFLDTLASMVNISLDRYLLGKLVGSAAVAVYAVGGQINTLYVNLSSAISSVFVPRVNKLVAANADNGVLSGLFVKVGKLQYAVLLLVLSGFILFGQRFILLWVGKGYEAAFAVAVVLMASYTVDLIQNIAIQIQRAKGLQKYRSRFMFLNAILNVIITLILIRRYQEFGAALGTAIANIIGAGIFMNWFYAKRVGLDVRGFWIEILYMSRACIPLIVFGVLIHSTLMRCSFVLYLLFGIAFIALYCLSVCFLGLRSQERAIVLKTIRSKLHRRAGKED